MGRDKTMAAVRDAANTELRENLYVAAHLIRGSSDERFKITRAAGKLSKEEVEGVGLSYMDVEEALKKYEVTSLSDGWHETGDDKFFYVSNPGSGLCAERKYFTADARPYATWDI
jgi:hypothetical protein